VEGHFVDSKVLAKVGKQTDQWFADGPRPYHVNDL
jgi:hypothetical protein